MSKQHIRNSLRTGLKLFIAISLITSGISIFLTELVKRRQTFQSCKNDNCLPPAIEKEYEEGVEDEELQQPYEFDQDCTAAAKDCLVDLDGLTEEASNKIKGPIKHEECIDRRP